MTKEPDWRAAFEHPGQLLKPYRRGLNGPVPIPSYVHRWLAVTSYRQNDRPQDKAAAILTEACHTYFRLHAPALPFRLRSSMAVDPPNRDTAIVQRIEKLTGDGASVFNGAFAWFFDLPQADDAPDKFRAWVTETWFIRPATVKRGGWPVISLPRGDWPIDLRLIPGTPFALAELNHV